MSADVYGKYCDYNLKYYGYAWLEMAMSAKWMMLADEVAI